MKKITKATVKKFIRENFENMYINVRSEFDGMTDCCEHRNDGWKKAEKTNDHMERTLGIKNAWFVGDSRDYFNRYESEEMCGIEIYNSCGFFILATKK